MAFSATRSIKLPGRLLFAVLGTMSLAACDSTGPSAPPARLEIVAGDTQKATVASALAVEPVVRVVDARGKAVTRVQVRFAVTAGNGSVANATATSDSRGQARPGSWTLGTVAGANTLTATVAGIPSLTLTATGLAGPPQALQAAIAGNFSGTINAALTTNPVVRAVDSYDNPVSGVPVTWAVVSGGGSLAGSDVVTKADGTAAAGVWTLGSAAGLQSVTATSAGLVTPTVTFNATALPIDCSGVNAALPLDLTLGEARRFTGGQASTPNCLLFDAVRHHDQQFLVMFENVPRAGDYSAGLFPGSGSGSGITVTVSSGPAASVSALPRVVAAQPLPPGMSDSWDFGAGPIYEFHPPAPAGGVAEPVIVRGANRYYLNSAQAAPKVGDTLVVFLSGVPRLNLPSGNQPAIIRHISNELIIAEDARLGTLTRQNGATNQPLTPSLMDSIAQAYAAYSKVQGDLLFGGRYNNTIESETPARVVAVHTLMPADNVWGYTYSSTSVFAWDYWVGTDGSTRGLNQHVLRNAYNLFMHEIAHMRHWGIYERSGRTGSWGNMWLIEGFARFTERLPIGSYLLKTADVSRTGNLLLPRFAEFGNSYFRDDVPTYLNAGGVFFAGYQSSSYIFDYLADQVAATGGNWRSAITTLLENGALEADLNTAVNNLLPGLTFSELLTRARIALYLDDIGNPGLPGWTQYLQYQLRASRPPGSTGTALDPRNAWPVVLPGASYQDSRFLSPGTAFGYLLDGSTATSSGLLTLSFPKTLDTVLSITRVR